MMVDWIVARQIAYIVVAASVLTFAPGDLYAHWDDRADDHACLPPIVLGCIKVCDDRPVWWEMGHRRVCVWKVPP